MKLAHVHMKKFEEYKPYIDTLVLPIGTVEAHGPHAPLGTDMLIPERLAELIERQLSGRIWTAPPIAYGHVWNLQDFPGTINVPQSIFADYVHAVVASFARWGLKHVVLLNGHGGNIPALNEVANRLVEQGLNVMVSNYWLDYQPEIREITPGTGHAGEDETSLVMAVDPQHVDLSLVSVAHKIDVPKFRFPGMSKAMYPEAYSGDAPAANREKGERLFALITERVVQDITSMWSYQA